MYRHKQCEADCGLYLQGSPRLHTNLHDLIAQKTGNFVNTTVVLTYRILEQSCKEKELPDHKQFMSRMHVLLLILFSAGIIKNACTL